MHLDRFRDHDPPAELPRDLGDLADILACPLRVVLLLLLSDAELDVATIARIVGYDKGFVSRHLNELRRSGLLEYKRDRYRHVYGLGPVATSQQTDSHMVVRIRSVDGAYSEIAEPIGPRSLSERGREGRLPAVTTVAATPAPQERAR